MPTFLFFKNGQKYTEVRGADAGKLQSIVAELAASAKPNVMDTPGRTLGAASATAATGPAFRPGVPRPGRQAPAGRSWSLPSSFNLINALLTFFGLYFASLFSVRIFAAIPVGSWTAN